MNEIVISWAAGLMTGALIAVTSCLLIRKAVGAAVMRSADRQTGFFLFGFLSRFLLFASILYLAVFHAKASPVALVIGFTVIQLSYPIYLVKKRDQHV